MSNAQFRMDHVRRNAQELCNMAAGMGLVVTIERKPLTPLATGHAEYDIHVREKRTPAESIRRVDVVIGQDEQDHSLFAIRDGLVQQARMKLSADFDVAIASAITKLLGHNRWTLEEMRGRLHEAPLHERDGWTAIHLDCSAILNVGPIVASERDGLLTISRELLHL